MTTNKTQPTTASVEQFLAQVEHPVRRQDGFTLLQLMKRISGQPAVMWGPSIVGFGAHEYTLASGTTGTICQIGFSPRSNALVLYLGSFSQRQALLDQLGKHRRSKGCIYVNRLEDIQMPVLEALCEQAYLHGN
ncbi:DUF1801 domain-containing protein [Salinimonas marina]|uniref:DUF1801 domain-containing protein n=1 Tax=Salinimonas marina TaxID=2785918 RepID=A0A7S9DWV2_9ALTE|nr:DUF1801 domain-containing protein [Salinimonas marina]QPG05340.1 DUF1801 domain-containing protein [Salinimonas marina]